MKPKKEFYAFILSAVAEKGTSTRKEVRRACREHFDISDKEWDVKKRDGTSKCSNRIDWAIQDLRNARLIEPKERGVLQITESGKGALCWNEHELVAYVSKKIAETRKTRYKQPTAVDKPAGVYGMKKIMIWCVVVMEIAALTAVFFCAEHRLASGIAAAIFLVLLLLLSLRLHRDKGGRRRGGGGGGDNDGGSQRGGDGNGTENPTTPPEGGTTPPKVPEPEPKPPREEKVSYFEKYLDVVGKKHGEDAKARLRSDVEDLLGSGPESPDEKDGRVHELLDECAERGRPNRVNGLVVGRVQSGKTQNYAGVILRARDIGYNVFIILTNNISKLANQTHDRFLDDTEKAVFKAIGLPRELYCRCGFLRGMNIEQRESRRYAILDEGKFFIGFAQKEQLKGSRHQDHGHLPRIKKWFEDAGIYRDKMRVLVIDDEADAATPNSEAGVQVLSASDVLGMINNAERKGGPGVALAKWIREITSARWDESDDDAFKTLGLWLSGNKPDRFNNNGLFEFLITNKSNDYNENDRKSRTAIIKLLKLDDDDPGYDCWMIDASGVQQRVSARGTIETYFNTDPRGDRIGSPGTFLRLLKYVFLERERSIISKSIVEICGQPCERLVYIGYTATPFANIGNETPLENPLYPQFVQSMQVSPEYFGFEKIFPDGAVDALSFVRLISGDEHNKYVVPAEYQIENWQSLKNALMWAFCSASCRRILRNEHLLGDKDGKLTTMFININRETKPHAQLKKAIQSWLEVRKNDAEWKRFVEECKALWATETNRLNLDIMKKEMGGFPFENANNGKGVRDWSARDWALIQKGLDHFKNSDAVEVVVLNSDGSNKDDAVRYDNRSNCADDKLWIVCGGNTISRGLTLDGLTTSYYDRVTTTTCVDTMSQMGRWFGFRSGYELLPRVWMPVDVVRLMRDARDNEKRLHDDLRKSFSAGCDTSDPNYFQPLYASVQRLTGRDAALTRKGEFRLCDVAVALSLDEKNVATSWNLLRENVGNDFGGQYFERHQDQYQYASHPMWRNVPAQNIVNYLKAAKNCVPAETAEMLDGLLNYIASGNNDTITWDVVIADVKSDTGNSYCPFGENDAREVGSSNVKADEISRDGSVVYYHKKTMDYLSFIAGLTTNELEATDIACREKYGEKCRRGASIEYRDMAYHYSSAPKLQLFLITPPEGLSKDIPLVKYAFEWPGRRGEGYRKWVVAQIPAAPESKNQEPAPQGSALSVESVQTADTAARPSANPLWLQDIATRVNNALDGHDYVAVKNTFKEDAMLRIRKGEVDGFGLWSSASKKRNVIFITSFAKSAEDFFAKIKKMALDDVHTYLLSNRNVVSIPPSSFASVTNNKYSRILDQNMKDFLSCYFNDCTEDQKSLFKQNGLELVAEQDGRNHGHKYVPKTCIRLLSAQMV